MNNKDIAQAEERLATYSGKDEIIDSYQLRKKLSESKYNPKAIQTDIGYLDYLTGGFREGELIVLSGKSGNGKTTFGQTLTYNFAVNGVGILWFTYEIAPKQFLAKFPVLPHFYMPKTLIDYKLQWLEDRIIEAKVKYDVLVIFIDHLGYITPPGNYGNKANVVGDIMRELKKLCVRHNIIMFLLSHIAKTAKINEALDLDDLKDASAVHQEADFVAFIQRGKDEQILRGKKEEIYNNNARLSIRKNRFNGLLGYVYLNYNQEENLFKEENKNGTE